MTPTDFPEVNAQMAEEQEEYETLPVCHLGDRSGRLISLWQLTWAERFRLLFTGRLWISMLTYNQPPMPILPHTDCPFIRGKAKPGDV